MLTRVLERLALYGAPEIAADGREVRQRIGEIRGALVARTSEETEEEDLDRAVQTVYAVIPARYMPPGGFRRGMEIVSPADGGVYRILTPTRCGAWWSLKCSRVFL